MSKLLIDSKLLERLQERLDPHIDARDWGMVCDTFRAAHPAPDAEAAYAMGAKGGEVSDAERVAFESWMAGHCWALCAAWDGSGYKCESEQGGYFNPAAAMTRRLWAAWRDRAALAATVPAGSRVVPVELLERIHNIMDNYVTHFTDEESELRALLEVNP